MQASIHLDGLEDLLRAIIREELQAGSGSLSIGSVGFLNTDQAAEYLATTPGAVRAYVKRGQLVPSRRGTGRNARLLFTREQLDAYVRGEDG